MIKKKEIFKPLNPKVVTMYNCGLTVYDYNHVGNLRAAVFADLIRRFLEYKGFSVRQVMNFTDVGHMTEDEEIESDKGIDKMEKASKKEGRTPWEIAEFYINAAMLDYKKLNIEEPEHRPRASEHIKEMIEMIQILIEKGYAYVVNNNVYFDISKFKKYGKLSGNTLKKLKAGAGGRVSCNPDKKSPFDFALWISDPKHLMFWKSPWSEKGYPGWHIECSVMSKKYLGDTIDIHTGGEDNIFPHHECEIAQSEAASGKKFVKIWMHMRHLLVNGEKMSKSKGNFFTLKDLEEKGIAPRALRWSFLLSHYRSNMNLTIENLQAAEKTIQSLIDFLDRISSIKPKGKYSKVLSKKLEETKKGFDEYLSDDLNVSPAVAEIFELVKETNKAINENNLSDKNLKEIHKTIMSFDKVLGVLESKKTKIPKEIKELLEKRLQARSKKDFKLADALREQLNKKGWLVEDTSDGPRLIKK